MTRQFVTRQFVTWTIRDNHTSYYLRLCDRAVDPNLGSMDLLGVHRFSKFVLRSMGGVPEHGQTFIGLKKVGGHCARVKMY